MWGVLTNFVHRAGHRRGQHDRKDVWRNLAAAAALLALLMPGLAAADWGWRHGRDESRVEVRTIASGLAGTIGGAVGPDGALYVPQFALGEITRIDVHTGQRSTFASGLPQVTVAVPLGGAFDVAFDGDTAYVLVSLVGPEDFGRPEDGGVSTGANGIYRIDGPDTPTLIADLGAFSADNPPTEPFDYFLQGGVQYAMEAVDDGLLVTDGHHNRVLHVSFDGDISVVKQYGNVVPAGLDVIRNRVFLAETGTIAEIGSTGLFEAIGQVTAFNARSRRAERTIASGISMAVDVQFGPGGSLYALSQGDWDPTLGPAAAGGPALPFTGRLLRINPNGSTTTLVEDLLLPTSLHFIGRNAYIVTLAGEVLEVTGLCKCKRLERGRCGDHDRRH